MTLEQIEGNEPIHENWGAETGDEIDEVMQRILDCLLLIGHCKQQQLCTP